MTEGYKRVEKRNAGRNRENLAIEDGLQHVEEVDGLEVMGGMIFRILEDIQFTQEVNYSDLQLKCLLCW